jgi:short-subunit dehydrogenase
MRFPYRVVAITGASTGLGAEMAAQLGRAGCKVALIARNAEKLAAVAEAVRAGSGTPLAIPCNVDDWPAVQQAVARTEAELGPIECMIANAGVGQKLNETVWDPAIPERIMRTNFMGMVHALYATLPFMQARGRGHLVGVASMASYQGVPDDGGYSASKAAQRVFLESLRVQLHGSGVKVTCICPGFVRTPMTDKNDFDMPFLLEADEACRRMLRAIAAGRRVFNFPKRINALVSIGTHTPRWMFDRALASAARSRKARTQGYSDGRKP